MKDAGCPICNHPVTKLRQIILWWVLIYELYRTRKCFDQGVLAADKVVMYSATMEHSSSDRSRSRDAGESNASEARMNAMTSVRIKEELLIMFYPLLASRHLYG